MIIIYVISVFIAFVLGIYTSKEALRKGVKSLEQADKDIKECFELIDRWEAAYKKLESRKED